jgi:hypothetical protein
MATAPKDACYTPNTIDIDMHSDVFRVSFVAATTTERYYLSVATMGQKQTVAGQTCLNMRPKLRLCWYSELEQQAVAGRVQVCHMLLAARNSDHLAAILASAQLLSERRGFTEIEHITRELKRTSPQDLTLLSRRLQQQNVGCAQMYLRDVDNAVARAYRLSRQPTHLLANAEHLNMTKILLLRQGEPLTATQMGGPLAHYVVVDSSTISKKCELVRLCEAKNCATTRRLAQKTKQDMIKSLGVLIATIATGQTDKRTKVSN